MKVIYEILKEIRPTGDFENSKNFVEDGMLDSFDVVSLVAEIENRFNIKIERENIKADCFKSIDSISELIRLSGEK